MLRSAVDLLLGAGLLGWLVLSVPYNIPRWRDALSPWDYFSLLPGWTFFAPVPGTSDYHWLFRDRLRDGTLTPWTELSRVRERSVVTAVLNPDKRKLKTMLDIIGELSSPTLNESGHSAVAVSLSYLLLLHSVCSMRHPVESTQTQFLVMSASGVTPGEEPKALFLSAFHDLGAAGEPVS